VTSVKVEQLSTALGTNAPDHLLGTAKNDWFDGGLGNDDLGGGAGSDTLIGGGGNDTLRGGAGTDTERGGAGDDVLIGGHGHDRLEGDDGADTFLFHSIGQSPAGANRDTLTDFNPEWGDKIDLSEIDANAKVDGDQSFAFIGNKAFTGNADDPEHRGELRYHAVKGGIVVSGDVDGDHKPDFEIFVAHLAALKAADLIL
jgi:Ca2+-binding RTX toxin-like protein